MILVLFSVAQNANRLLSVSVSRGAWICGRVGAMSSKSGRHYWKDRKKKKSAVPDRWQDYVPYGRPIPNSRFIGERCVKGTVQNWFQQSNFLHSSTPFSSHTIQPSKCLSAPTWPSPSPMASYSRQTTCWSPSQRPTSTWVSSSISLSPRSTTARK